METQRINQPPLRRERISVAIENSEVPFAMTEWNAIR